MEIPTEYEITYNDETFLVNPEKFMEMSNVFRQIFNPEKDMHLNTDTPVESFRLVLDFINGIKIDINSDNAYDLSFFASELDIPKLKDIVNQFFAENDPQYLIEILTDNDRPREEIQSLIPIVAKHFSNFIEDVNLIHVKPQIIYNILNSKELVVSDQHKLFDFLMKYTKVQPKSYNMLNFINVFLLNDEEREKFFNKNNLPQDEATIYHVTTLMSNLIIFYRNKETQEKYKLEQSQKNLARQKKLMDKRRAEIQNVKEKIEKLKMKNFKKNDSENLSQRRDGPYSKRGGRSNYSQKSTNNNFTHPNTGSNNTKANKSKMTINYKPMEPVGQMVPNSSFATYQTPPTNMFYSQNPFPSNTMDFSQNQFAPNTMNFQVNPLARNNFDFNSKQFASNDMNFLQNQFSYMNSPQFSNMASLPKPSLDRSMSNPMPQINIEKPKPNSMIKVERPQQKVSLSFISNKS